MESKKELTDLFRVEKETDDWAFLLNTIVGVLSFTLAVSGFTLTASWKEFFISSFSLVFVVVLTNGMKARRNTLLKRWRAEKLTLEKSERLSNEGSERLNKLSEMLFYAEKNIFTLKKVSAFAFGFYALSIVCALNIYFLVSKYEFLSYLKTHLLP